MLDVMFPESADELQSCFYRDNLILFAVDNERRRIIRLPTYLGDGADVRN